MIREATHEDMPRLLEYSRHFYELSGYEGYADFDEGGMAETLRGMIDNPEALVLITDGGYTGAVLYRLYFSLDMAAQELFWYVEPSKRKGGTGSALKRSLEAWAASVGAKLVGMSALEASNPEKVAKSYRRDGYVPVERSFIRRL